MQTTESHLIKRKFYLVMLKNANLFLNQVIVGPRWIFIFTMYLGKSTSNKITQDKRDMAPCDTVQIKILRVL